MTASYPSSVKSFTTKVDFTDTVLAAHVNDLQDEVNSIEATLGSSIKTGSGWVGSPDFVTSSWNTVKDRITNLEYVAKVAYDGRNPTGGTTGQVLVKNSSTNYDYSWTTFTGLPSQSGNNGKYLTTDGSSASWATIAADIESVTAGTGLTGGGSSGAVTVSLDTSSVYVVPSQSTHAGKYLTTDGTTASWATVTTGGGDSTISDSFMLMGA